MNKSTIIIRRQILILLLPSSFLFCIIFFNTNLSILCLTVLAYYKSETIAAKDSQRFPEPVVCSTNLDQNYDVLCDVSGIYLKQALTH